MNPPLLELEGTAEEIRAQLPDFDGQRLHVTVRPLPGAEKETTRQLTITERLLTMADEMPPEERAKMPADLAEQHDHYLYGWKKTGERGASAQRDSGS